MNRLLSVTDPAGSITSHAYDPRGLAVRKTDPLQKISSALYDALKRPVSQTDRNGATLTYGYTATGNLATVTYPDGSQTSAAYDELGRLARMQDSLGESSRTYDEAGRIIGFRDSNGFSISYTYDESGNPASLTYPDGSTVTYTYDTLNRLSSVASATGETATYTYDEAGRLSIFTHFNGIIATYTYDAANGLLGMESPVSSHRFTLNENGSRIHAAEEEPLAGTLSPAAITYAYDKNRLLSTSASSYSYDSEGQLASANGTPCTFDYDHRLSGIGSTTRFFYDARGNRLKATRNGVATHYIYDPWGNLLAEADGSKRIVRKYLHGRGLLAVEVADARYCYHFNATGSTTALTDTSQNIVNKYAYDPFGTVLNQQETIPQPFKFVGRYGVMAEPNGLYYMRTRYYDPGAGRFISEDPLGFGGGDVNLYAYVQNDPVNAVDPLGLAKCQYSISAHTLVCWPNDPGFIGPPISLSPDGVFSGMGECRNSPPCSDDKNIGPIPPGDYNMNPDNRPGHERFWRLEPNPIIPGWKYYLGLARSGFELHPGSVSLGCITTDKNNPFAMDQYGQVHNLLQSESGSNALEVVP